jgi:hypothetical protein
MLLQLEALSIAESTDLYQSHLDTARLDLSRNRARSKHKDSRNNLISINSIET